MEQNKESTRKIQEYEQTTFETCLAVDLLQLAGMRITREAELKAINYAMKYSKENFTIGHLDFISKTYDLEFDFYVDNNWFLNFINKFKFSDKIHIFQEKIGLSLIDEKLDNSPVIVYVDSFALWKITHAPHFIIVIEKNDKSYKIYDPWDGKTRFIDSEILLEGINSLRDYLKYCPQLIQKARV